MNIRNWFWCVFLANRLIKKELDQVQWPILLFSAGAAHVMWSWMPPWGAVVVLSNLCVWITFVIVWVVDGGWWVGCIYECDRTRLQVTAVGAQNKKLPSSQRMCHTPFLYTQCHICSTGGLWGIFQLSPHCSAKDPLGTLRLMHLFLYLSKSGILRGN